MEEKWKIAPEPRGTFFISEVIPGRARARHLQAAQAVHHKFGFLSPAGIVFI